ncbi:unnamed protein product (macronuclear) [Paramecium tetraurelia]|uniref:HMG box domain-containing protein n=1 Tax=Paramecium tetraurelia TaxID=5888 RepID=A0DV87_PARTE|nr:uncharacterized protein GSPATT00020618001 [Paramecium tetraurelia]CAK86954.1 unnamed protein product [Paramecium tetraurelia]|eukprot:XP_001454351.1 hypothetical protein (macronuclear) [Paramecium tetraurelia strain d4-2]
MQNSKQKEMFCSQFDLYKDKKFQFIPSLKQVKVEESNHPQLLFNESSAEDIFEQMGNQASNQVQIKEANRENKIKKNDDWNAYYNLRLKEIKLERPELTHNQMTQLISEEWKIIKKQFKKYPQSLNPDEEPICKKRIKSIKDTQKFSQEIMFQKQESEVELDFNPFQCAKFIENLRSKKFKLVINDITHELPGIAIIEAVDSDSVLIYLNQNTNNNNTYTNTTQGTPNEKVNAILEDIGSDSELSICKGNEDFILQNNIRSFL